MHSPLRERIQLLGLDPDKLARESGEGAGIKSADATAYKMEVIQLETLEHLSLVIGKSGAMVKFLTQKCTSRGITLNLSNEEKLIRICVRDRRGAMPGVFEEVAAEIKKDVLAMAPSAAKGPTAEDDSERIKELYHNAQVVNQAIRSAQEAGTKPPDIQAILRQQKAIRDGTVTAASTGHTFSGVKTMTAEEKSKLFEKDHYKDNYGSLMGGIPVGKGQKGSMAFMIGANGKGATATTATTANSKQEKTAAGAHTSNAGYTRVTAGGTERPVHNVKGSGKQGSTSGLPIMDPTTAKLYGTPELQQSMDPKTAAAGAAAYAAFQQGMMGGVGESVGVSPAVPTAAANGPAMYGGGSTTVAGSGPNFQAGMAAAAAQANNMAQMQQANMQAAQMQHQQANMAQMQQANMAQMQQANWAAQAAAAGVDPNTGMPVANPMAGAGMGMAGMGAYGMAGTGMGMAGMNGAGALDPMTGYPYTPGLGSMAGMGMGGMGVGGMTGMTGMGAAGMTAGIGADAYSAGAMGAADMDALAAAAMDVMGSSPPLEAGAVGSANIASRAKLAIQEKFNAEKRAAEQSVAAAEAAAAAEEANNLNSFEDAIAGAFSELAGMDLSAMEAEAAAAVSGGATASDFVFQ